MVTAGEHAPPAKLRGRTLGICVYLPECPCVHKSEALNGKLKKKKKKTPLTG